MIFFLFTFCSVPPEPKCLLRSSSFFFWPTLSLPRYINSTQFTFYRVLLFLLKMFSARRGLSWGWVLWRHHHSSPPWATGTTTPTRDSSGTSSTTSLRVRFVSFSTLKLQLTTCLMPAFDPGLWLLNCVERWFPIWGGGGTWQLDRTHWDGAERGFHQNPFKIPPF